jgi:uncharacterized surface protein with fasciclin (FAS1) repeats
MILKSKINAIYQAIFICTFFVFNFTGPTLASSDLFVPKNLYDALTDRAVIQEGLNFNTLKAAIDAADLKETVEGLNSVAIFAPTDRAFSALPEGVLEALLSNKAALVKVLTRHIAQDDGGLTYYGIEIDTRGRRKPLSMLNGAVLFLRQETVATTPNSTIINLYIGNAKFIARQIKTYSGSIFAIDAVL